MPKVDPGDIVALVAIIVSVVTAVSSRNASRRLEAPTTGV